MFTPMSETSVPIWRIAMGNTPPAHEGSEYLPGLVLLAELLEVEVDEEETGRGIPASMGKPFRRIGDREWDSHPDCRPLRPIDEDLEAIRCSTLLLGMGMLDPLRLEQGGDRPRPDVVSPPLC